MRAKLLRGWRENLVSRGQIKVNIKNVSMQTTADRNFDEKHFLLFYQGRVGFYYFAKIREIASPFEGICA